MKLMAAPNETFWDHVIVALVFYKHIYTTQGYGNLLSKRARALGFKVSEDLNMLPQLAIILHDLGKAYEPLQTCVATEGTASYHEYVSVAASSEILNLNALKESSGFFRDAVLLSIVWHHTAMRGSELVGKEGGLRETYKRCASKAGMKGYEYHLRERNEINRILKTLAYAYGLREYLCTDRLPDKITIEDVIGIADELALSLINRETGLELYTYTLLLLHPLMVCDNYSANTNRMGRLTRFLIDLPTLREIIPVRESLWKLLRTSK